MTFVELETLTDRPFGRIQPVTCGDYVKIVDMADGLDWYWSGLTTLDLQPLKQAWWEQFALTGRNKLVFADPTDVASGNLLISRDLNFCRLFCVAGGRALWVDYPHFRDVSGTNQQFLAACAAEGFDRATHCLEE